MGAIAQGEDLTKNSVAFKRSTSAFRPLPATAYPVGALVVAAAIDAQVFPDYKTVSPSAAAQRAKKVLGVVSSEWNGFDQSGSTTSAATNARGTQEVTVTTRGYHGAVLIDNTDATAVAITDGVMLSSSKATAGKIQGDSAPVLGSCLGWAALPAAGIGSSLGNGAVTQASQTATIAGIPAANDVLTVTVQMPYNMANPGVVQTRAISTAPLTAAQAASVNAAASALQAALAADALFSKYYTATVNNAVVTVTANAAALFSVYHATPYTNTGLMNDPGGFKINLSGTVGNSLTFACSASGGSTNTAGGATLANGAGYVGQCPAWIICGGA